MAMRSTIKRVGVLLAALMRITSCGGNDHPAAPVETSATPGLSQSETTDIATEAYAYAYPLVTMEYTRRGLTNVPAAEDTKAPMGQIARMRTYPNASFNTVTAPNADTPAAVLAQRQEAVDSGRDVAHPTGQSSPVV